MKKFDTKKLTVLALLSALAFLMVAVLRIPFPLSTFLKYEPKDVIITIAGFLYGPISSLLISVVVSFIEMVTISTTGWIGCIMNILSTAAFACTASFFYKKHRTLSGAIVGLSVGTVLMLIVMLLWNYILTPLYMDMPRADIAAMLVPVFLPFNLIKGVLNASITALLYRPLVQSLRIANLFPRSHTTAEKKNTPVFVVFYICTLVILALSISLFLFIK